MDPQRAARSLSLNRALIGALLTVAPAVAGRSWIGADAQREGAKLFGRAVGARDVALALGTLDALREGRSVRRWAQAAALADAVDFLATLAARDDLPRAALAFGLVMTGGSTGVGLWLSRALD